MSSTGFGKLNQLPPPTQADPVRDPRLSDGMVNNMPNNAIQQQYTAAMPKRTVQVPGMAPPPPYTSGIETPLNGLVPGHLPLRDSLDNSVKTMPYPASDRFDKPSFIRNPLPKTEDWRSVGVGPKTDRKSPGRLASSGPNQGKYMTMVKERLGGNMPSTKSTMYGFAAVTIMLVLMAMKRVSDGYAVGNGIIGVMILSGAIASALYYSSRGLIEGVRGLPSADVRDISVKQKWLPLARGQPEHNVYPKILDNEQTTMDRMKMQGTDMNNVEGPRSHYRYKRGPTPGNQQRLQNNDLMRGASQYNMDEYEFNEFMARLEGEAPDQFYQAHAYMPFSANSDHRHQVNDMDTYYGVSTQPGQSLRKFNYIDPRMQQAGAKTSHLKDPPPGSIQPLDKVHPWMQKSIETQMGQQAFNMDDYAAQIASNQELGLSKITANQIGNLAAMRDAEMRQYSDAYAGAMGSMGEPISTSGSNNANRPLPPGLQPIPTSHAGFLELQKKQQAEAQQRYMQQNGIPQSQMAPPYMSDPNAPPPHMNQAQGGYYERSNGMRPPGGGYGMGAPPAPVSAEEKANAAFNSVFEVKNQPGEDAVERALQDKRT